MMAPVVGFGGVCLAGVWSQAVSFVLVPFGTFAVKRFSHFFLLYEEIL
jgi:hypothetical protein